MGYWEDIKENFTSSIDLALNGVKDGVGEMLDYAKDEVHVVKLKKDLFLKHRELHDTLADLGDKTKDAYNEKGNIYREDIGEIMHKVTLIETECKKLSHEIEHIHDHLIK
ncbi:hypothetical protein ACFL20_04625 [Spirochaetota bacterium]